MVRRSAVVRPSYGDRRDSQNFVPTPPSFGSKRHLQTNKIHCCCNIFFSIFKSYEDSSHRPVLFKTRHQIFRDTYNMSVILATAGYDHKIRFWEAPSGICSRILKHPDSQGMYILFVRQSIFKWSIGVRCLYNKFS
jgi:hypothetical protein